MAAVIEDVDDDVCAVQARPCQVRFSSGPWKVFDMLTHLAGDEGQCAPVHQAAWLILAEEEWMRSHWPEGGTRKLLEVRGLTTRNKGDTSNKGHRY